MKFLIRRATNRQYYFTISGSNNEMITTSQTYVSKSSAQHAINVIKDNAVSATIVDMT